MVKKVYVYQIKIHYCYAEAGIAASVAFSSSFVAANAVVPYPAAALLSASVELEFFDSSAAAAAGSGLSSSVLKTPMERRYICLRRDCH